MADAGERFASEAICSDTREIIVAAQLGRREALAEQGEVVFLDGWQRDAGQRRRGTTAAVEAHLDA